MLSIWTLVSLSLRHYTEEGEEGASREEASGGEDFSIEDKWGKETQELIQKIPEVGGDGSQKTMNARQRRHISNAPLGDALRFLIFFTGVDDFSAQSNGTCALFHTRGVL